MNAETGGKGQKDREITTPEVASIESQGSQARQICVGVQRIVMPEELLILYKYHINEASYLLDCKQANLVCADTTPTPIGVSAGKKITTKEQWLARAEAFADKSKYHRQRAKYFSGACAKLTRTDVKGGLIE